MQRQRTAHNLVSFLHEGLLHACSMDVHAEKVKQTCWCLTPKTRDLAGVKSERVNRSELSPLTLSESSVTCMPNAPGLQSLSHCFCTTC